MTEDDDSESDGRAAGGLKLLEVIFAKGCDCEGCGWMLSKSMGIENCVATVVVVACVDDKSDDDEEEDIKHLVGAPNPDSLQFTISSAVVVISLIVSIDDKDCCELPFDAPVDLKHSMSGINCCEKPSCLSSSSKTAFWKKESR